MIRHCALAALLLLSLPVSRADAAYPEKPIHFIVGFPAGSTVDAAARLIAPKLAESLGVPVLVEDIPGAAGNIASERVVNAAPDGYAIAFAANGQVVMNQSLYRMSFDPVTALAPISQVAVLPQLLVTPPNSPAKSVQDLIALAKAQPGALSYASGGPGSQPHMAGALFTAMAQIDVTHVPYKGVVAAVPDLLAARVSMMFSPVSVVLPLVHEGRLRVLAVSSLSRTQLLPDAPTVAEQGLPGFDVTIWYGLLAPAKTPAPVISLLRQETSKALQSPGMREQFAPLGMDIIDNSPEEFAAAIKAEAPFWKKQIEKTGIVGQ